MILTASSSSCVVLRLNPATLEMEDGPRSYDWEWSGLVYFKTKPFKAPVSWWILFTDIPAS